MYPFITADSTCKTHPWNPYFGQQIACSKALFARAKKLHRTPHLLQHIAHAKTLIYDSEIMSWKPYFGQQIACLNSLFERPKNLYQTSHLWQQNQALKPLLWAANSMFKRPICESKQVSWTLHLWQQKAHTESHHLWQQIAHAKTPFMIARQTTFHLFLISSP